MLAHALANGLGTVPGQFVEVLAGGRGLRLERHGRQDRLPHGVGSGIAGGQEVPHPGVAQRVRVGIGGLDIAHHILGQVPGAAGTLGSR